jgi:GNAT superfamily N-acetyltransferase
MEIEINTDKSKLDIDFVNSFLSKTYWAENRTADTMKTLIDNSLNFGVYMDNKQIGYARIVTDYAQFAYLMDVFISSEHQKKGYSKELMKFMMGYEALKEVKVWRLATSDAHFLYEKFGFKGLNKPKNLMELLK